MNIILLTPKNIPFVNTILLRKRDSVNLSMREHRRIMNLDSEMCLNELYTLPGTILRKVIQQSAESFKLKNPFKLKMDEVHILISMLQAKSHIIEINCERIFIVLFASSITADIYTIQ